jgi:hypothetical protein
LKDQGGSNGCPLFLIREIMTLQIVGTRESTIKLRAPILKYTNKVAFQYHWLQKLTGFADPEIMLVAVAVVTAGTDDYIFYVVARGYHQLRFTTTNRFLF